MAADFSHLQDIFGNVPMVKRYTLLSLFFTLRTSQDIREIVSCLRNGLDKLSDAVPHFKAQIVYQGQTKTNWGRTKIVPLSERIQLATRDLRDGDIFPSMADLAEAGYPIKHLEPNILVPEDDLPLFYTAPRAYEESSDRPARVLTVQATFVRGGVILTFASNHTTMDMNGLGQAICLFAKACRGEDFSEKDIAEANQSRQHSVTLLGDDYEPGPEARYFIFQPRDVISAARGPQFPPVWANITISAHALNDLKTQASKQDIVSYITTNDAVSSFFWQRVTAARAARLGTNVESEINRQLSARRLFGLSDGYMGHFTGSAHTHEVDVYKLPLSTVAGKLRQALQDTDTLKFHVQAMATMLERPTTDKTMIGYGASLDADTDLILSSYAEIQVCQVSFGSLLGVPDAARRPNVNPWPGLVYLMPKDKSGSLTATVCLRQDDMERMREDEQFKQYATYVG